MTLLPCPFCGKPAIEQERGIGCKDSDCPGFLIPATPSEWNRRAAVPESRNEIIEECAKMCDEPTIHSFARPALDALAKRFRSLKSSQPPEAVPEARNEIIEKLRELSDKATRGHWANRTIVLVDVDLEFAGTLVDWFRENYRAPQPPEGSKG